MAGGWTRDGAVQDQIDDTVKDAVLRARARTPHGESAEECDDCGEPDPEEAARGAAGRPHLYRLPDRARQAGGPLDDQPPGQQGQPAAVT
jgi:hypothetical protein